MKSNWKKYLPIALIVLLMILAYLFELGDYVSYEQLKKQRHHLTESVQAHPILAPLIFIAIYIVATALSIPGGSLLSITGGFLFPQPLSTLYVVGGATIGATCIFLAAKTALGDSWKEKAGERLHKMQAGFRENAASYLLFLRLVPLFPFWLVNLAPAFFSVSLVTFVWTTFVGIIPGAFVFTQAGVGLGSILDAEGQLSIGSIFTTDIKIALIALAIFALIPIIIKKIREKKK
jgi:uncharacterized membrane protein YdjX (TVP38/TMEM64 family)